MKAIICKWECPSCGNILRTQSVLEERASKYYFGGPNKCGCGRTGKFNLLTFEPGYAVIVDDKTEIVPVPAERHTEILELVQKQLKEEKKDEN